MGEHGKRCGVFLKNSELWSKTTKHRCSCTRND
nr:MAG TPA_asm: hypothetical protein [Caudoviricetes sp.]